MIKQQKTEDQLKTAIYNLYSRYLAEPASDRRQVEFAKIYSVIISWCTEYLGINANEMGIEIYNVIQRLVKSSSNVPNDETGFFKYLNAALYTAKKEYYRNNKTDCVDIPRDKKRQLQLVKKILATKESNAGRKLTENERRQYISEWFGITEYVDLVNLKKTSSLNFITTINGSDNEMSYLDTEVKSIFSENDLFDSKDEYFSKPDMADIINAFMLVFNNMQDRSRDCYRALFTAYCIKKSIDFEGLSILLDNEILEAHQKDGKVPRQHEIYLKYHPDVKKDSAGVRATEMLKKLFNDVKWVLSKRK